MNNEFLSVSELNHFIRDVLSSGFPQAVWVTGEIQGYDRGKDKKHVFFELCEKDPVSHEIVARAGLVIFANTRLKIDAILKRAENAFVLKDDIEVKFLCKVDFYPAHGQVRLIVESIDPVYTLGKIAQDRQRLIAELKTKGVLERNKRLDLARVPLHIGLITSYDSAAYHDFVQELRSSGFGFKIFIVNTLMQGKNAESSVVKALKVLQRMEHLDAIVITRGGGSIAELSCFDSAAIATAIAESRLPVLSGIGHEINTTITDLAAYMFAKTPTALAQLLAGRVQEFAAHVQERYEQLVDLTDRRFEHERRRLKDCANVVHTGTIALVRETRYKMATRREQLKKTIQLRLQNSRTKIKSYQKLIELADPKNTLKRGFSITRDHSGKILRSVDDVEAGTGLVTLLADGQVHSKVDKVSMQKAHVR